MGGLRAGLLVIMAGVWLAFPASARGELRLTDLAVYLNDHEFTIHIVAVGAVPPTFDEPIQTGIPAHLRFTIELWQLNRGWRDRLLTTRVIERHLTYNVVSKEFRVASLKGETRPIYATRDLRDAQRVISEVRAAKLSPTGDVDPNAVIYVRVRAETALNGENTFVARMAGTAEQTELQSDYRTVRRVR
ncbi:MAG: DUF4390 domain-containing protein [Candidatus Rokuibacteriota bacterium]